MQEVFEKIIEKLEELQNYACFPTEWVNEEQSKIHSYYANKLTEILKLTEQYNNGWIPCSERLPEQTIPFQTAEYTVTMRFVKGNRKSRPFTSHANFDYESGKWMIKEFEIIAWREQIEPYQPKGE